MFYTFNSILIYPNRFSADEILQCTECFYNTNDYLAYSLHLNEHLSYKLFKCFICNTNCIDTNVLRVRYKNDFAVNFVFILIN